MPSRRAQLLLTALLAAAVAALAAAGCASADQKRMTSWEGFRAGHWPGADWRPYAADSPFNTPIAQTRVHPRSRAIVARILSWGEPAGIVAGVSDSADDYAHPTYYARSDDPVYRLRSQYGRSPFDGRRIRIPAAARPAGGGDAHMTVVQPDGWEYDFWQVRSKPRGGKTLRFTIGDRLRIDGSGLHGDATAAGFGNLAGIIRAPELAAGQIDHALFLVVRCTSSGRSFGYGVKRQHRDDEGSYVFPADGGGAPCDDADAPPMGARLQLAMSSTQIAALGLPAWKQAVLHALATYGGYVGDTGGPGFGVQIESSTTYTAFGRPDPLVQFAQRELAASTSSVQEYSGRYVLDLAGGVDWARYLRVVTPPHS
jgi:hypothetical protein